MSTAEEEVRRRISRARRSGTPHWLWPEVPPAMWRAALLDIERVTRQLAFAENTTSELKVGASYNADALGVAAYTSGMGPLLGYWSESGRLYAHAETNHLLDMHLQHARRRMENLTAEAETIAERAAAEGVDIIMLKGMHTAYALFPQPGTRPVADVDVLVERHQLRAFQGVLRACGYYEHERQQRPAKTEWRKRNSPVLPQSLTFAHSDDAFAIDVHSTLDRNFFGVRTVRLQPLLDRAKGESWREQPNVRVSSEPLLTLFLAVHASEGLHNLRLIRIVELCLVIKAGIASGALNWAELEVAAESAGALRFAYPALALSSDLVPGLIPPSVLEKFASAATPAMRRVIGSLTPGTAQRIDRISTEERVMWAGTRGEKLRRLLHGLWPAPAGNSLPRLAGIYARRAWSALRGTFTR